MPSPSQYRNAARGRLSGLRPDSPLWRWVGWQPGAEGRVGIVRDGGGRELLGIVSGNQQPRLGSVVGFIPGQPLGLIKVHHVEPVGAALVPVEREPLVTYRFVYLVYGTNPSSDPPHTARATVTISNPSFSLGNAYDLTAENTGNVSTEADGVLSISATITPTFGNLFNTLDGAYAFLIRRSFKIDLPDGDFGIDVTLRAEQIASGDASDTSVRVGALCGVFKGDEISTVASGVTLFSFEEAGTVREASQRITR